MEIAQYEAKAEELEAVYDIEGQEAILCQGVKEHPDSLVLLAKHASMALHRNQFQEAEARFRLLCEKVSKSQSRTLEAGAVTRVEYQNRLIVRSSTAAAGAR